MAQFIEVRNAKTDEQVGIRVTLSHAKLLGISMCGTDGFILTIMQIDVNSDTIVRLLGNHGGFAHNTQIREYSVSEDGEVKVVK